MIEIDKNYKSLKVNGLVLVISDLISHLPRIVLRAELPQLYITTNRTTNHAHFFVLLTGGFFPFVSFFGADFATAGFFSFGVAFFDAGFAAGFVSLTGAVWICAIRLSAVFSYQLESYDPF